MIFVNSSVNQTLQVMKAFTEPSLKESRHIVKSPVFCRYVRDDGQVYGPELCSGSELSHNSRSGFTQTARVDYMCCLPVTVATAPHTMTPLLFIYGWKPNYTTINESINHKWVWYQNSDWKDTLHDNLGTGSDVISQLRTLGLLKRGVLLLRHLKVSKTICATTYCTKPQRTFTHDKITKQRMMIWK